MGFRTKQVHAGVTPDPTTGAILTPIFQSTTFVQDSVDEYMAKGYSYSRDRAGPGGEADRSGRGA
jgi:O-acetylhomoserine/O-acetylserine sulfhydrylase-like pyridoxal-dependent enzyme